jgi:Cys-tRNA(Pro)/Cys-tRNA(Cys) deacylase
MAEKLNSMRLLEANKIPYEVMRYDDGFHDAAEVAALLGVPIDQVYKTLVVERAGGEKPVLVMIGARQQLDLKKFAASIGQKKVNMASHADAERLTGLKVGGIGALALVHKHWDVYLDKTADALEHIYVSAGQRGINLKVAVKDLVRVLNAKWVDATSNDGQSV